MATDLETTKDQGEAPQGRPSLKITGLHIRGLKSIKTLDLPEDGLGWNGSIPDFVMVGGINGSGKTTLLEFLATAFSLMNCPLPDKRMIVVPPRVRAIEARIDFWFDSPGLGSTSIRYLIGTNDFIQDNAKDTWFGLNYFGSEPSEQASLVGEVTNNLRVFNYYTQSKSRFSNYENGAAVIFFPSEGRTLMSPETQYKFAGQMSERFEWVYRWQPPKEWADSLEARLYAVRWEDLNAKESGESSETTHFRSYQLAFDRFFEGRKQIKWTPKGELVVETKNGDIHDLADLSSGEKQVILFMGELLHRWRPGSLILIDEQNCTSTKAIRRSSGYPWFIAEGAGRTGHSDNAKRSPLWS